MLHARGFLFSTSPIFSNWKTFLKWLVAPKSTSSCPPPPIPLFFSVAFLPPLRVTLTHFALFFHDRVFRLPSSFPTLGLARLEVKPRLSRSSWRNFATMHQLLHSPSSFMEVLFACSFSLPWIPLFFSVELTLSSICFWFHPLFSCEGAVFPTLIVFYLTVL